MTMSTILSDPEHLCPPLFDLLELVDAEDPPLLLNPIQPLLGSPNESTSNPSNNSPCDAPLHTFPDPSPLQQHYLHEEVAYRPEDQLPIWSLEPFCDPSPLPPQHQPSEPQFCSLWHSQDMEIQHEHLAPQFIIESTNLQDNSVSYFQSTNPHPPPPSSRMASPLTTESSPATPVDYTPWTLPVRYTPSPTTTTTTTLDSPFSSLSSSSSEAGVDTALYSPYMESEPELFEGFEPEPGFFQDPTRDDEFDPAQRPAFASEPARHAHGYMPNLDYLVPAHANPVDYAQGLHCAQGLHYAQGPHGAHGIHNAQDEAEMYSHFPDRQTCTSLYPSTDEHNNTCFTCENGHSYDEQHYLGNCEGVDETYSNLASGVDGEGAAYCGERGYDNHYGSMEMEDSSILTNMGGYDNYSYIPRPLHTTSGLSRADIHQVLVELKALKSSLQSIPERTKRDYAQYHNTLAKLGDENAAGRQRVHREDLRKMYGVSQLSAPTKANALHTVPPARPPASPASPARAPNLPPAHAIDRDTMAKLISRKSKKNVEMEGKNPLDTFIKGSKVIRLTHSYQQLVCKPVDPTPKKRKTKKEVIEHIHKQIPEFSTLPPPAPKAPPKKPNKDFWKTLENF